MHSYTLKQIHKMSMKPTRVQAPGYRSMRKEGPIASELCLKIQWLGVRAHPLPFHCDFAKLPSGWISQNRHQFKLSLAHPWLQAHVRGSP